MLRERVSAQVSATRTKTLKGAKSEATMSKGMKAHVEYEMEQAHSEKDARNVHVGELEACATKLEKQLGHSASQARVSKSKRFDSF